MAPWPQVAVGALIVHKERVLLVERANPPRQGYWSLPGGRVEPGETLHAALIREISEETSLSISPGPLLETVELIDRDSDGSILWHYLILDYQAQLLAGTARAGDDARALGWFTPAELTTLKITESTRTFLRTHFPSCGD